MNEHLENNGGVSDVEREDVRRGCGFPYEYLGEQDGQDLWKTHNVALDDREGGGRKGDYCQQVCTDPDGVRRKHDRMGAFARRRELKGATRPSKAPADRPVSSSAATFETLLSQFRIATEQHRDHLDSLVARAANIVATAGDPDQALHEVRVRSEAAEAGIGRAASERDAAVREAQVARRERDRALEDRALAEGAAEDAIADRDEKVAESAAAVELAHSRVAEAEQELVRVRAECEDAIAAARDEMERARTDAADRIAAAADAHAAEMERVRVRAAGEVEQARAETAEANTARQLAEHDRDIAAADAAQARIDAARVRKDADNEIRRLQSELGEQVRAARTEREQLIANHVAELARQREDVEVIRAALDAVIHDRDTNKKKK